MAFSKEEDKIPNFVSTSNTENTILVYTDDITKAENVSKGITTPGWTFYKEIPKQNGVKIIKETYVAFSGSGTFRATDDEDDENIVERVYNITPSYITPDRNGNFKTKYMNSSQLFYDNETNIGWDGIGSFVFSGDRNLSFNVSGTGEEITQNDDGIIFKKGKYLTSSPPTTPLYERVMVLMEVTVNERAGTILQLNGDIATKMSMTVNNNGDVSYLGTNNQLIQTGSRVVGLGGKNTIAYVVDRTGLTTGGRNVMVISNDGYSVTEDVTLTTDFALRNMRMGQNFNGVIHKLAIIGRTTNMTFGDTPIDMWKDFSNKNIDDINRDEYELWFSTGHSLNSGRMAETTLTDDYFNRQLRHSNYMLSGVNNTKGQPIPIEGAVWGVIDTTSTNLSVKPAEISGIVPNSLLASKLYSNEMLRNDGNSRTFYTTSSAAGGATAANLSNVLGNSTIYNNSEFLIDNIKNISSGNLVRCVNMISIGTSDRTNPNYKTDLFNALEVHKNKLMDGVSVEYFEIIYQSPGSKNTSELLDDWKNVLMSEYDLAIERNSLLIPLYPYKADGHNDHPNAIDVGIYSETAGWALSELSNGRKWNIDKPIITNINGIIKLDYENSFNDGEYFMVEEILKYESPLENYGFELVGGIIDEVEVGLTSIDIKYSGNPTSVKYAMQFQNVSGEKYFGFRGVIRTNNARQSCMFDNVTLYRYLPSLYVDI